MKLGELIIELGITGDIRPLKKALSGMDAASTKSKLLTKYLRDLKNARTDEERATIKSNFAQKINTLHTIENINAIGGLVKALAKIGGAAAVAIGVIDRLNNSLLRANQSYITFSRQSGISISRLNKMAGVAKLSGMNLPAEQVANDLAGLQQKIFRLTNFGEGSEIFAQLGINPMGMESDQFLNVLRYRFKTMSAKQKSYTLDMLGLSQEWLNVLELSDKEYQDLVVQSSKLQLSEKERKELAKYTLAQQKNNMRFELAKQRLLITTMPLIIKIMDYASKIAEYIAEALGDEKTRQIIKDVATLFGVIAFHALRVNGLIMPILKGLAKLLGVGAISSLFGPGAGLLAGGMLLGKKGVGQAATSTAEKTVGKGFFTKLLGILGLQKVGQAATSTVGKAATTTAGETITKTAGKGFFGKLLGLFGTKQAKKILAKQGAKMATTAAIGAAATPETLGVGGIIAAIVEGVLVLSTIYDLIKLFFNKEEEKEENQPPVDNSQMYSYQRINSNMTNHFYNNPIPAKVVTDELDYVIGRYLGGTKR